MLDKAKALKSAKFIVVGIILVVAVVLVESQQKEKQCEKIVVDIENEYDNYFVAEGDILSLITEGRTQLVLGTNYSDLNLKKIENRIKTHKFVSSAQVFRDLKGNLKVEVKQCRPIARIMQADAPDAYISDEGKILPVSDRFTSRVMLITGAYTKKLVTKDQMGATKDGQEIFKLIEFINEDEFWKAQIAEIHIDRKGEITLYTQVSKQFIEFGKAEDLETKFKKLRIFYKQILPQRGWNRYERVNIKYHNQIVCE